METAEVINAIAACAAVAVSILSLVTASRRATQAKTDEDIEAVVKQVRALELEIARNYPTKQTIDDQISQVANRLERSVRDLMEKFDRLNEDITRFLREGHRGP